MTFIRRFQSWFWPAFTGAGVAFGSASVAAQTARPTAAAAAPAPARATSSVSTAKDRKQVSITVYNQNFGLVREVRELSTLPTGRVSLDFQDVAATIQPQTVHIRALGAPGALSVLEQNYRFDLLTPEKLLEKFVGRKVRVYRYHPETGKEDVADADLLSVAERPVLRLNGEVTYDYGGRFAFPEVPENLIARPTLMWLLDSRAPKQNVEVTYLAQNLNWSADYVLVVNEQETRADLNGWVTLVNQSGTGYENAELKLVAGDVHRAEEQEQDMRVMAKRESAASAQAFREEGLFEYHLYTLGRPTTVLQNEQKQVTLLEAKAIGVKKKLIFYGPQYWFRGAYGQVLSNQKVGVYVDIQNSEKNGLGMPLPKGILRVYKADKSGAQQFVGEDRIDHTPRDEKVRIKLGDAFDVVGDRRQMSWTALGGCASESAWQIELRNHKDTEVEVQDYEPVGGEWTIITSSQPAEREDAHTFTFTIKIPARGKVKLTYTARVRWC